MTEVVLTPKWKYNADISWIVNHPSMTNQVKFQKISQAIHNALPKREHVQVCGENTFNPLEALSDLRRAAFTGTDEDFEEALESLYATCDFLGLWLSAPTRS